MLGLHLLLAVGLAAYADALRPLGVFAAFVAVYLALRLAIDLLGIRRYLRRLELGTAFALWFVGEIFRASVGVARIVLGREVAPQPAELARQRLARVLAEQNKVEDALKLLDGEAGKAWQASREELRGDLLVRLGRSDEAHAAYQKAKDALAEDAAVGGLQMKLDDLAKGDV